MAIAKLFKSFIPSINYVFKDGTTAPFIGGRFHTTVEEHIKELEKEINVHRHPTLFIDPQESEIDTEAQTPLEILKNQIRKDLLKELAVNAATDVDHGGNGVVFAGENTGIGNSRTIDNGGKLVAPVSGDAVQAALLKLKTASNLNDSGVVAANTAQVIDELTNENPPETEIPTQESTVVQTTTDAPVVEPVGETGTPGKLTIDRSKVITE